MNKSTRNGKSSRIQLDTELIADLEAEDTSDVKGGASGGSGGIRTRSGSLPTSSVSGSAT